MSRIRTISHRLALDALYWSGAHRMWASSACGRGAILMFHHVRRRRPELFQPNIHLEVTPDFLRDTVQRLRQLDIDIVDLDEACARLAAPQTPRRFVVLTFDDGYRNNLTEAYPILKSLRAPFTVYVATGLVDGTAIPWWDVLVAMIGRRDRVAIEIKGRGYDFTTDSLAGKRVAWRTLSRAVIEAGEDEQRRVLADAAPRHGVDLGRLLADEMMNWDEIGRLAADPLVRIGAHTVGHYALSRLAAERARDEMSTSRDRIEAMTGMRPRHFAYPYGVPRTAGSREFAIADELGFTTAVTTRRGVLTEASLDRPTALPRISVNGSFQSIRYLDVLLSGLPFALEQGAMRVGRLLATPRGVPASASTR